MELSHIEAKGERGEVEGKERQDPDKVDKN